MKVVDLINDSQDEVRPTVLVSATAVGYYGTSLQIRFLSHLFMSVFQMSLLVPFSPSLEFVKKFSIIR